MLNLLRGSEKRTNFLHIRESHDRFTVVESLFTLIHGQKMLSFVLKVLKIVRFKTNLLLNNTLKTY